MNKRQLLDYVQPLVLLTDDQAERFVSCFNEVNIKKRQFIVYPGLINEHRSFVIKGAFRSYTITDNGQDHTVQFAKENSWVLDFNSYISQRPSTLFIIALEDAIVLQIDYEKELELKKSDYRFEALFRKMAEEGLAAEQQRIAMQLKYNAEGRYESFVLDYPNFVQRVPAYALASYLGMSARSLSQIKNKRV